MTNLDRLYNRFDPAKNYDSHLFLAGRNLQSAELNEIQSALAHRISSISNVLFKDGDLIRDAAIIVDAVTGETQCQSGAVYLQGAVRGAPSGTLTIPVNEIVMVGLYLRTSVVSELEDKTLRDPADHSRNYGQPGALRKLIDTAWGYLGDGQGGEFYPIYTVDAGIVRPKEPPPNLDAVTQALARYDRDSAGGSYVVSGLSVAKQQDLATGEQVYTVNNGRARVNGFGVELSTGRRLINPATPDLRFIDSDPYLSTTAAAQRISLNRTPVADVSSVHITQQKTATISHGGFTGAQDVLPDTSIVSIIAVNQGGALKGDGTGFTGGTTYAQGVDYKLTSGKIDWSLPGAEVVPGSTYQVIYQCITTVLPTALNDTGFTVTGAVVGTQILVNYNQKLPRIDTLCLDADGNLVWLTGVAADYNPQKPPVPSSMLALASVQQTWAATRAVSNDGVRVVPMQDIANLTSRIDFLASLIAQQNLKTDASNRDTSLKKGMFVDPFLNDGMRDQGVPQTAAIVSGKLTLPVDATPAPMSIDVKKASSLPFTLVPVLEQTARTGSMLVNPYMAFDAIPAVVSLTPSIDRWTDVATSWASPITQRITEGGGLQVNTSISSSNTLLSTSNKNIETLRQIAVQFSISGFGPDEALKKVAFDGIDVTPSVTA